MKIKPFKKYTEQRPWGNFVQFTNGQKSTIKIITVEPRQALSLQLHHHRDEFWKVIDGKARVIIGDDVRQAGEGDEFYIKRNQKHRVETDGFKIKVLEISFGDFDENDIVRLEDRYNRNKKTLQKTKRP
jgi:mannose-6-phosphate isomerase-like protein (cupin superfamily)